MVDEATQTRVQRVNRTDRIERLLIIGYAGYISLDALRWLTETRTALMHVDTTGKLLATNAPVRANLPGLRRAQALAADGPAGLQIARYILSLKLAGQRDVLTELPHNAADAVDAIGAAIAMTATADTIDGLLDAESYAASMYWRAWERLSIPLPASAKVPEHWRSFGQRASLLTGAPRVATNPANAILNYLYALLESETIVALHAVGLDPGLGVWHTDQRDRASLALDLMEAVRPAVDAYALAMLTRGRMLNPRDYAETREGACRLSGQLAEALAASVSTWRDHIAPVAEWAANLLASHATSRVPSRTPLTQQGVRDSVASRLPTRRQRRKASEYLTVPNTCRECGVPLTNPRRRYCELHRRQNFAKSADTGRRNAAAVLAQLRAEQRDPAHGGNAAHVRGAKNAAHQHAVKAWTGERPDPDVFASEILPGLRHIPIARITAATGLGASYASRIRLGKVTPHPRHWQVLRELTHAEMTADQQSMVGLDAKLPPAASSSSNEGEIAYKRSSP